MVDFLTSKHRLIGKFNGNSTISRTLYYPPVKSKEDIVQDQLRCGEHSDYGTFTLLIQDEVGGLQVSQDS